MWGMIHRPLIQSRIQVEAMTSEPVILNKLKNCTDVDLAGHFYRNMLKDWGRDLEETKAQQVCFCVLSFQGQNISQILKTLLSYFSKFYFYLKHSFKIFSSL